MMRGRLATAIVLGIALILSSWLVWPRRPPPPLELVAASVREPLVATSDTSHKAAMSSLKVREPLPVLGRDPFASQAPTPPPLVNPPTTIAEPPRPTAPPVPFHFFGRVTRSDGTQAVFLSRERLLFEVAPGEILGGTYRVDKIGANSVDITYLPLAERQVISIP